MTSTDTNRPLGNQRQQNGLGRSETQLRLARRDDAKRVKAGYPRTEPLTIAEADAYLAEYPLTCLLCGQQFRLLAQHLGKRHGMSRKDYGLRFGLPLSRPLCTPEYSAASRATQVKKMAEGKGWTAEQRTAGQRKSAATPRRNSTYRNTKVMLHLDKLIAAGRVVNQKRRVA